MQLAKRLFDVDIEPADGQVWRQLSAVLRTSSLSWADQAVPLCLVWLSAPDRTQTSSHCLCVGPAKAAAPHFADATPLMPQTLQAPVWHPDVRFFLVKASGVPKAYFYLGGSSSLQRSMG